MSHLSPSSHRQPLRLPSALKQGAIALTLFTLSALTPTLAIATPQPPTSPQTLAQSADLQSGRAVVSGTDGEFVGQVLVNTDAETAWTVLTDYENFERFLPGVASSQVLEQSENQTLFEQVNEIRVLFFSRQTRVRISTTETFPSEIQFQVVDGDVEAAQGRWQIDPVDGNPNQVLITHQVSVEPGPDNRGLFLNVYRNNLRDTLNALRREMERRTESAV